MPATTQTDFAPHVYAIQRYVAFTSPRCAPILEPSLPALLVPSFGDPATATVVTVGLNPSRTEFESNPSWSTSLDHNQLARRCTTYFSAEPPHQPNRWFGPWSKALAHIGASYQAGSAVHLDLSPRTLRCVVDLKTGAEQDLFLETVDRDLWMFFGTLALCANAKLILMAGSVTGRYYMNEFLQRHAPDYGHTLDRPFNRLAHPGRGKTAWHRLSGTDRSLPVFFCSSSPSDRSPTLLPQRIQENAALLQRLLAGTTCTDLP